MKKYFSKETVTSLAFLLIIFTVSILSFVPSFGRYIRNWIKAEDKPSLKTTAHELIDLTKDCVEKDIAFQPQFIRIYSQAQKQMNTRLYEDAEYGWIIRDNNNKLHFPLTAQSTAWHAKQTVALQSYLENKNIPMLYIVAPCKYIEGVTKLPYGIRFYNDQNTDEFLAVLKEAGVDSLDLRQSLQNSGLDLADCHFKTDHHWKHQTAFFAYKTSVDFIRERYQINLDPDAFYTDLNNYYTLDFKNAFLGSQGRRVGAAVVGKDDVSVILPKYDTDYRIYDGTKREEILWQGAFEDTILRRHLLSQTDEYANMYGAYFEFDFSHLIIQNQKVKNGKHIIVLKDSFGLPFSAFLSTTTETVEMIDMRGFDHASLCSYLAESNPDLVIVMCSNGSFSDTRYDFCVPES